MDVIVVEDILCRLPCGCFPLTSTIFIGSVSGWQSMSWIDNLVAMAAVEFG